MNLKVAHRLYTLRSKSSDGLETFPGTIELHLLIVITAAISENNSFLAANIFLFVSQKESST